jgi:hypothetical protein
LAEAKQALAELEAVMEKLQPSFKQLAAV